MVNPYQKAYDAAIAERGIILEKRVVEDRRLAQLEKIIESLGPLVQDDEAVMPYVPMFIPSEASLADACRLVMRSQNRFMMPSAIRDILIASGYDQTKQTNLLASVHSICSRFEESGEADKQTVDGKTFYRIRGNIDGLAKALKRRMTGSNKLSDLKMSQLKPVYKPVGMTDEKGNLKKVIKGGSLN